MTEPIEVTLRVTGVRSQNPMGFGGAIFTGVPIDATGSVLDAGTYVVVRATREVLGATRVERGQWWRVRGPVAHRTAVVDGFTLNEQQLEADAGYLAMPSGEHIVTFIAECPAFEGFGTVKARRLWERYGEALYQLLEAGDPTAFSGTLTQEAAQRLVNAWQEHGQSQNLQWLQAVGLDVRMGKKALRFFGDETRARIEEDPYRLLSFTGKWVLVDQLAKDHFGVMPDDPRRLRGAIEEACYRMFALGHTTMLTADLTEKVSPLLGRPPSGVRWRDMLSIALSEGLSNGSVIQTQHGLQQLGALVMERQVARAIQERLAGPEQPLLPMDQAGSLIAAGETQDGIELNPEQRQALHMASVHRFCCITGGAGVGKTTVLKALYRLYDHVGTKVLQVALAGRAAKRMQEATGRPALTIASFLNGVAPATFDGPTVLVVDEASMVDLVSMSRICQVLPAHVRLVLVGDPFQLMPVGPGLVFHCVLQVPGVPVTELKTVKRYGGEIAAVATAVRAGRWRDMSSDETAPIAFIPCERRLIAELVVELYALDTKGTQVLAPLRNGPAGTKTLNMLCQERFTKSQPAIAFWSDDYEQPALCGLNLGDMVLCTRNLWDKGLQNGSLGRVVEVVPMPSREAATTDDALAWVEWDDGIRRAVTVDMLDDLELGYSVTVHKAQGSQWRRVIIPVTDSRLLDRTLLYTAITRAQLQVILVGDVEAARRAVLAPPKVHSRKVALDLQLAALLQAGTAPRLSPLH
ncbi:AAA family ATPase [Hydrogenophaga sp.]|uniref:AAA family ATPase n=1 Tax=Hydrogenophaga sp. TaxID=1904254 RepID=UPI00286DC533|nr:AAA family ATPase [Hydrogenophaga sp.]